MYLVTCSHCREAFANEARICPTCGHVRRHVVSAVEPGHREAPIVVTLGETEWKRGYRFLAR